MLTGRLRRAILVVIGLVVLIGGGSLAAGAVRTLGIHPAEGPSNTPYRVTVRCVDEPNLVARPLSESPPETLAPLPMRQIRPGVWSYDAVADGYDDLYSASCTAGTFEQQRFDVNAPRLLLGPLPSHGPALADTQSKVQGTDCPDRTRAEVTITLDGHPATHVATIDRYGDWAVQLPVLAGTRTMLVRATCGSVHYAPLVVPATTTVTAPTAPGIPVVQPPPDAPHAPAPPVVPLPGPATFTG